MKTLLASLAALFLLGAAEPPAAADGVALDRLMADAPAPKLSDYRLFVDGKPNAGLTPYDLATPLFSDYAQKTRYLYLPPGAKARYRATGALDLPVGAVLVKTFAYPADFRWPDENVRWIETRLLIHRKKGWVALPYVWNAERSEAVLKRAGTRVDVEFTDAQGQARRVDYHVPNTNQCKECHELSHQLVPIGVKARNLNTSFAYPEGPENELAHWTRLGLLQGAPAPEAAPRTARWDDPAERIDARARAYLDANCGHCHNPKGHASNSGLFLDLEEQRPTAIGIGKRPVAAGKGSGGLEVSIAPGRPDASIIVHRMDSTEPGVMMPELGRSLTHEEGVKLIREYIASLK